MLVENNCKNLGYSLEEYLKMLYHISNLSFVKRQFLLKSGKGANKMTHPELILKLVEQLLAEREKNIKLQSQLEEYKKSKD